MSDRPPDRVHCKYGWFGFCAAVRPWHVANALAAAALLWGLSGYPLLDPDEGRYGEIPREMLERGDLLSPTLNYVPYWEKPPLLYWLNAAALHYLGESPFAVRIGTAVVAVLGLLVAWWLARVTFGSRAARWAPAILASSWMYFAVARVPIIDMLVSVLMAASLTAWFSSEHSSGGGRLLRWVVSGLFLGLATLAKGPVALVLVTGIVGVYLLAQRRWRQLLPATLTPLAVGVLVAAPWFVAMAREHPDFLHYFLWVQHVQRFLGSDGRIEHARPVYFYLGVLVAGFLPWSFLWPGMTAWLGSRWRGMPPDFRRVAHYLLSWTLVVLCFFSASTCKLAQYVLPAWWPLAVTASAWLASRVGTGLMPTGLGRALGASGVFLLLLVVGVIVFAGRQQELPPDEVRWPLAVLTLGLTMAAAIFLLVVLPGDPDRRLGLLAAAGIIAIASLVPAFRQIALRRDLSGLIPQGLVHLPPDTPWTIAQYRCYNQNLNFITHRRIVLVDQVNELSLGLRQPDAAQWFLQGEESIARLAASGPLALVVRAEIADELADRYKLTVLARNADRSLLVNQSGLVLLQRGPSAGLGTEGASKPALAVGGTRG